MTRSLIRASGLLPAVLLLAWAASPPAPAPAAPPEAAADGRRFEDVHGLIKPQPDESRWRQIPWLTSVWEARQLAAREGKPLFIWAGSGGGPVGVC